MKTFVKDLQPNPYRRMKEYPIDKEKVESLKLSIKDTSFWDNILARPFNGKYQIAYGHHRLIALKELGVKEVDIPVRELEDGMMIKIMANENRDTYKSNKAVTIETVRVVRDYLREEMKKDWDRLDASIQPIFGTKQAFGSSKGKGVGWHTVKAFLNGDWKDWEIKEAIGQLDDDSIDKEAMKPFKSLSEAGVARQVLRSEKVPKEKQKEIVNTLIKEEVPHKQINARVKEIMHGLTREVKKPEKMNFDKAILEASNQMETLETLLRKIRKTGVDYIESDYVRKRFEQTGNSLLKILMDTFQTKGGINEKDTYLVQSNS